MTTFRGLTQFRSGLSQFRPAQTAGRRHGSFRPGATLADDIIAAYRKAIGEDDPDDDPDKPVDPDKRRRDPDQPEDDRPEQRTPDQTRIVATADGIIAAMKKAAGELR
jgi:hypothetical protein